jgi:Ser/Thr protein kinase RdoA (MazF antagonist)
MQPFDALTKRGQVARLKRLALNALFAFDLEPATLELLQHSDNTTFRLNAGGERYMLRIHRGKRTPAEIRSEVQWLDFLSREEGLIVPSPVPTRDGDFLTIAGAEGMPEPRTCVLFRWVEGRFLEEGLRPAHLEQVGAFMARLHNSGARFNPPEGFVRGRVDHLCGKPRGVSEAFARSQTGNPEDEAEAILLVNEICSPEDGARVEQLIRRIRGVQLELGRSPETFGLVHGDLHQGNYLFYQGTVRAIDFDDGGYGHYLYDLAVTLFNIDRRENTVALRAALLAGYHSVRPLSAEQEAHLETFMHLRELQMMLWVIEMRDHPQFREGWQADVEACCRYIQRVLEPN